ncbi:RNA polymerase sigma factor [Hymenobacter guriensis]|uniref:Sigma-70 family RNA polymerase sigma factor n=1 Tax=Hymenobacter guriensis TaxID=2793065 RepID=A0ABS0L825_9BACT|nr:sigma-70 family RNA polymerase sigma factor [Hymenobacter guriensis]MBG8556286.1 sigma-70 family RNA polymerase sigma factor [Hymenobacter guriensis]
MFSTLRPNAHISTAPEAEALLVQRLYAREETAMSVFYDRYGATLYRFLLTVVKSPAMAEDALQDALIKIWFSFASYDASRGRLFTWALQICRYQALDTLRRVHNRPCVEQQATGKSAAEPSTSFQPEHLDVRACLRYLRPDYQVLMELRYFDGLSQAEVAEHLDMPVGTVKTQNRAALRQLAAVWRER